MEKEYKIIHVNIFDPSNTIFKQVKNDKAECTVVRCNNSENCVVYKKSQCIMCKIRFLSIARCPHGKRFEETGPTRRARGIYDWVKKRKEQYGEYLDKLKEAKDIMSKTGDYIWLPYSFIDMNTEVPFLQHSIGLSLGYSFLKVEDFTLNTVRSICRFRPQAMMGGEIRDYQKTEVPMFFKHWKESGLFSDIYAQFKDEDPRLKEIESSSNIGRKAVLKTLTPNVGYFGNTSESWTWDGEYLVSRDKSASVFLIVKAEEVRVKPIENSEVVITDDGQVNSSTIFTS